MGTLGGAERQLQGGPGGVSREGLGHVLSKASQKCPDTCVLLGISRGIF